MFLIVGYSKMLYKTTELFFNIHKSCQDKIICIVIIVQISHQYLVLALDDEKYIEDISTNDRFIEGFLGLKNNPIQCHDSFFGLVQKQLSWH